MAELDCRMETFDENIKGSIGWDESEAEFIVREAPYLPRSGKRRLNYPQIAQINADFRAIPAAGARSWIAARRAAEDGPKSALICAICG